MFKQLPIAAVKTINVTIDGRLIRLAQDMTVAAAVLSSGQRYTRTTPVSGAKRAPFCMMGVCFDCLMIIDGKPNQRACATYVQEGMRIESQQGLGPELKGEARG